MDGCKLELMSTTGVEERRGEVRVRLGLGLGAGAELMWMMSLGRSTRRRRGLGRGGRGSDACVCVDRMGHLRRQAYDGHGRYPWPIKIERSSLK